MESNSLIFTSYEVSGCKRVSPMHEDDPTVQTCEDREAEFWSIYGRCQDNLAHAIGDFTSRETAEVIMNAIVNQRLNENSTNIKWRPAGTIAEHTSRAIEMSERNPYEELIFQFVNQGRILADVAHKTCWRGGYGTKQDPIESEIMRLLTNMAISIYHNKFTE